jgi:hypothetical protein
VVEVAGAGAAEGDGQPGGLQDGPDRAVGGVGQPVRHRRLAQPLEDLLVDAAEQLGQDPVHDHGGDVDPGVVPHPVHQLDRLVDRHLLRRGHDDQAGGGPVGEQVGQPARLLPDLAHVDQVVDGLGRGQLAHDVAGGRGVDHHQVVVVLLDLPADLADGEDLPHAGGGGGHEVEHASQGPEPGHRREVELEVQVLPQRGLGVHGHVPQVGGQPPGLEPRARRLEEVGQVALGVDLAGQGAPAVLGAEQGQGRGHRALPDPPLAGDEEQPAVEEVERHLAGAGVTTTWWPRRG